MRQNDGLQICNVVNVLYVAADMMPGGPERAMRGPNASRKQSVNRKTLPLQTTVLIFTPSYFYVTTETGAGWRGCTFSGEPKENDRLFLPFLSALLCV